MFSWVTLFLNKRCCHKLSKEAKFVSYDSMDDRVMNVTSIMNEYSERDIYNKKYFGLFLNSFDKEYLSSSIKNAAEGGGSKEPLTSVVACNMDCSDKQKMVDIRTSKIGTFL